MPLANSTQRLRVMLLVLGIVASVCAGRLVQIQGLDAPAYAATASKQLTRSVPIAATRGTITDRDGVVLAVTSPAVMITADPTLINNPEPDKNRVEQVTQLLMKHVGGDRDAYVKALTRPNTRYSIVARKVPAAAYHRFAQELSSESIYGVFRESDPIRTYPERESAAALVGFVGADSNGQGGLEFTLNKQLAGTAGREMYEASPAGYRIPLGSNVIEHPSDGVSYQLTIDADLQAMTERKLAETVAESEARSGMAIAMDIKTGEVLAMANAPSFDPNNVATARSEDLFNRAVTQAYEPGSVQKVITMAALMDAGLITPDTRLIVPPNIQSGGSVVRDVWKHGYANVTARGVLAYSSNIGTIMMTRQMDTAEYRESLVRMGLGQRTGIELPGEATGFIPPADMPGYTRDQISFGQGLSVTAIQNAAAVAGILNGGVYNPPTVLRSATDVDGNPVPIERRESRRVVSPETSRGVASMMESVVGPGAFAGSMAMDEYRVGGKTGTSENFDVELGAYSGYTSSFVGMAPAEDPRILTYVVVEDPQNGHTGGAVAGPVAWDMLRVALPRYGVPASTGSRPTEEMLKW
ncbi:peptidoglycan D,D-transpeptidase FtsI family protein [Granulicoccus sp. GXG6511]|uniref:peptidoglycan D,D-transpeptidase FtsI family protein n=1 Tax=Granulicoccus sp. GXG6511 TaxID=3381351 RepID=UPI003D7D9B85